MAIEGDADPPKRVLEPFPLLERRSRIGREVPVIVGDGTVA
jgi:hypothetical protein